MAVTTNTYATAATVTITLTSLANSSLRQSTVVDNTTNKYLDALLRVKMNGATGGTAYCNVWGYSAVGDTTYTDGASGTDGAFTGPIRNCVLLGIVNMNAATGVVWGAQSIAQRFGGVLPDKWGIIVENLSGAALSATAGDFSIQFEGVTLTTA